jgi:glycosyltransferase involved in cell wall biosynthesis
MRFSIVTPSYRSSQWLRLCIASVADQQGVEVEHIVQDSCSDDGTQEWLPKETRVKAFIEKDQGMYDAVNRGFQRTTGELLAYLNCDEQYLPGTLKAVHDFFAAHPAVDVVCADTVVTDPKGEYICHRCALPPGKVVMWAYFPVLTCALFVRSRVVHELGIHFDVQWKALGDWFWVRQMVERGLRFAVLPRFTSIFTDTGDNLCLSPQASRESQMKWQMAPSLVRALKYELIIQHRLTLALRPPVFVRPFSYSLFSTDSPGHRVVRQVEHPTSFWRGRFGK